MDAPNDIPIVLVKNFEFIADKNFVTLIPTLDISRHVRLCSYNFCICSHNEEQGVETFELQNDNNLIIAIFLCIV